MFSTVFATCRTDMKSLLRLQPVLLCEPDDDKHRRRRVPEFVQTILDHLSISMTMDVYGHPFESPEDDVEMFEKMEANLMAA